MSNLSDFTAVQAGLRNRIINGEMDISQRGTSFAGLANGTSTYFLDRFSFGLISEAVVTVSQQADVPSTNEFQNSMRVAVTTADTAIAAGQIAQIFQPIEGYNVRDLIGRTFTISFWVRSSKTGVHCVALLNSAADRSYIAEYTITAANTWEQKSITVNGGLITAGTWNWTNGIGLSLYWTMAAGSTFHTTANAWQTGNFRATANQVNCLDLSGNVFAITGVQLELGAVATPFEQRPIGMELALCQRYALVIPSGVMYASGTLRTSGTNSYLVAPAPVTLRAAPTLAGSTNIFCGDTSASATIVVSGYSTSNLYLGGAHATVGSNGQAATLNSSTAIVFSAEL